MVDSWGIATFKLKLGFGQIILPMTKCVKHRKSFAVETVEDMVRLC